ncbi:MAG: helix-turn-helix domain-containing protein [Bacillota bacterium]
MDYLELNIMQIKNRIDKLDLKHSWLASRIGVSEKTVQRWVTGKTKHIRLSNAVKLAENLQCNLNDIIHPAESFSLGNSDSRNKALRKLYKNGDFYRLIGSTGIDDLHKIFSTIFSENLDSINMIRVLMTLAYLALVQYAHDEAELYIQKTIDLAKRKKCYDGLIVAYSYLACSKYDQGEFRAVRQYVEKAIAVAEKDIDKLDIKLSVAYNVLSIYHICLGECIEALKYINKNLDINLKNNCSDKYHILSSILFNEIYTLILMKENENALTKTEALIKLLAETGNANMMPAAMFLKTYISTVSGLSDNSRVDKAVIEYVDNYKSCDMLFPLVGRLYRLQGRTEAAIKYLCIGLRHLNKVLPFKYMILQELIECYKQTGQFDKQKNCLYEADAIRLRLESC